MHRIAAILLALAFVTTPANAAPAFNGLPPQDFPVNTKLAYIPNVTDEQLDCKWNFDCHNNKFLLHFQTQEAIHRLYGWVELGTWRGTHGREIDFALSVSEYETPVAGHTWAEEALSDFVAALESHGYRPQDSPLVTPESAASGSAALRVTFDAYVAWAVAFWKGTCEAEGMVVFNKGRRWISAAGRASIRAQMRDVLRMTPRCVPDDE